MPKAKLIGNNTKDGMSTLELLIAFGVGIIMLTAATMAAFGNQTVVLDASLHHEALGKAARELENARATAFGHFNSLVSTAPVAFDVYTKELVVEDMALCRKRALSRLTWMAGSNRPQKIELTTDVADISGAVARGGDCDTDAPVSSWNNPQSFASDHFNPTDPTAQAEPTGIDVLDKIAYMGADTGASGSAAPYLFIADTRGATLGQTDNLFVDFTNGFDAGAPIVALDAVHSINPGTGAMTYYVYAALKRATDQFAVIDVTDMRAPSIVALRPLSGVSGGEPGGYRIYYYKNRVYILTKYTSGPEFHVFDVSAPANPQELGSFGLGRTANSLVVRDEAIPSLGGVTRTIAYLATDKGSAELTVLDVTNPANITELTNADVALPGIQNGTALYLVGNNLYFGRQSTPGGSDFYIFDATDPYAASGGLPIKAEKDINTGVLWIRVVGHLAFIATPKSKHEFQVWDISGTAITQIADHDFPNIAAAGIDYESDIIYAGAGGAGNDALRMIYSP
jgi:hypothetical protein